MFLILAIIYIIAIIPFQLTCMLIIGILIGRLIVQNAERKDKTNSIGLIFVMAFISVISGGLLMKPNFALFVADLALMYLGIFNTTGKRYRKKMSLPFLFNPLNRAAITREMNKATGTSDQEIKIGLNMNKNLLLATVISTMVYCLISFIAFASIDLYRPIETVVL